MNPSQRQRLAGYTEPQRVHIIQCNHRLKCTIAADVTDMGGGSGDVAYSVRLQYANQAERRMTEPRQ